MLFPWCLPLSFTIYIWQTHIHIDFKNNLKMEKEDKGRKQGTVEHVCNSISWEVEHWKMKSVLCYVVTWAI